MSVRIPPSRDTLFMRGFSYRQDIDLIRSFFAERCGKSTVEFFREDGKEQLFLALKFESKEIAKEVLQRFNETEVLGDKVFMSWYRDLRRARPFNDHRQQYGGGGGRDQYHHRRTMGRYENPRGRRFTRSRSRSRSKSRSRSGSSGSRSGGSSDRSQDVRRKNYGGEGHWNKWKHSNEKRRHRRSFERPNEGDCSDHSSRAPNKRPKQMFQSKVVAVNSITKLDNNNDSINPSLDASYNKEDKNTISNNNTNNNNNNNDNNTNAPNPNPNYIPMNINNNSKWGEVGRGLGGEKKVVCEGEKSAVVEDGGDDKTKKKTSQWTPINESTTTTKTGNTNINNNNVENTNQEDVLLGLRKQQLQKHLKEVLLKEAILKEQQILQQQDPATTTTPQQQQHKHSKQQLIDIKQQKVYEDLDGIDISNPSINNNNKYVEQHKQQQQHLTKVESIKHQQQQQLADASSKKQLNHERNRSMAKEQQQQQPTNTNNNIASVSAMMMMMKKKKKSKEKYQPFDGNDEVSGRNDNNGEEEDEVYFEYNKLKASQLGDKRKRVNSSVKESPSEVMMMMGGRDDDIGGDGERVGRSRMGLSQDKLMLVKGKKDEIEKNYKQDCETFSIVTKLLISKDIELEERLQKSLRENLRDIGHRSIQELKEFVERLKKEDEDAYGDEEDEDDDGIPLHQLF